MTQKGNITRRNYSYETSNILKSWRIYIYNKRCTSLWMFRHLSKKNLRERKITAVFARRTSVFGNLVMWSGRKGGGKGERMRNTSTPKCAVQRLIETASATASRLRESWLCESRNAAGRCGTIVL